MFNGIIEDQLKLPGTVTSTAQMQREDSAAFNYPTSTGEISNFYNFRRQFLAGQLKLLFTPVKYFESKK